MQEATHRIVCKAQIEQTVSGSLIQSKKCPTSLDCYGFFH